MDRKECYRLTHPLSTISGYATALFIRKMFLDLLLLDLFILEIQIAARLSSEHHHCLYLYFDTHMVRISLGLCAVDDGVL